jgi:hypothetical protein
VVDIFFWFLREIMTKWDLWYRRILWHGASFQEHWQKCLL